MTHSQRPKQVQWADLIFSIILTIFLIISAIAFGKIAISFGLKSYSEIADYGIEGGLYNLAYQIQSLAIHNAGNQLIKNGLSFEFGLYASAISSIFAPIIYVSVWARIAKLSLSRFISGIAAVLPRDEIDDDEVGDLPSITEVNRLMQSEDFQAARLSDEDRAILGRNGRYTPRTLIGLQRRLRLPAKRSVQPLITALYWGGIGFASIIGILTMWSGQFDLILPAARQLLENYFYHFAISTGILAAALIAVGIISTMMDLRFARSLAPRVKPKSEKTLEMLRDMTSNATPAQLLSVLKAELSIRVKNVKIRNIGLDGAKEGFVDQSNFFLELLIEGTSSRVANSVLSSATRRLWGSALISLFGAALPLLILFPSSLQNLMKFEQFELTAASSSFVWMLVALTTGRAIRIAGERSFSDADTVLRTVWHDTPIAAVRIDGTVNTQTALTGKAIDDSYGSENRIQQCRYDVRLMSSVLSTIAECDEADREITSFETGSRSVELHQQIAELLREEGSKSTFSAVNNTINDTQQILTRNELQKAELKLKIAQTQAELKRLEAIEPSEESAEM